MFELLINYSHWGERREVAHPNKNRLNTMTPEALTIIFTFGLALFVCLMFAFGFAAGSQWQ